MELMQKLLREKFPNRQAVITEITNLEAILNLPKPTEHFVSDLHGEFPAFDHVLRNGSGNIKQKIIENFGDQLTKDSIQDFATLVYYPEDMLLAERQKRTEDQLKQWYLDTFARLIELLKISATKYTRSKVRKALDPNFAYITEELLYTDHREVDKRAYYNQIMQNLLKLNQADQFIIATCYTIQHLIVDHLHVIGDIFDRGPEPDQIMERLMNYHSVDIQWGNHDILWLGAVSGSALCLMNLLRISARYDNLGIIEDHYGINLRHLFFFADQHYQALPAFYPKTMSDQKQLTEVEKKMIAKVQAAVTIIQFKLEGQLKQRRPEWRLPQVGLLGEINWQNQTVKINGQDYELSNQCFATVDQQNPSVLTAEEKTVTNGLLNSFINSSKLRQQLDFMMQAGSMYKIANGNLLFHGCVPVDGKGKFLTLHSKNQSYTGQALFCFFEKQLRQAYAHPNRRNDPATDWTWYLWQGPLSPLFGKHAMTTFARYFVADQKTHIERKNPYFVLRREEWFCRQIMQEFGLDPQTGHVINGHTPVKRGQEPIMANKKMIVIDGGFSKAYQPTTGIGGYTLLSNSYGLQLVSHHPFTSKQDAIKNETDIISTIQVVNHEVERKKVADTDTGKQIKENIRQLHQLLKIYASKE